MRYHVLCPTCRRDGDLAALMVESLRRLDDDRLCDVTITHPQQVESSQGDAPLTDPQRETLQDLGATLVTRRGGYGQWCWRSSMSMVNSLVRVAGALPADAWVSKCDSDVLWLSKAAADVVAARDDADIVGWPHSESTPTAAFGPWSWMSGSCLWIRAETLRRIGLLGPGCLNGISLRMQADGLSRNEDVVVSYLAATVGARPAEMPGGLLCRDNNGALAAWINDETAGLDAAIAHLNGEGFRVAGRFVRHKWEIPKALSAATAGGAT